MPAAIDNRQREVPVDVARLARAAGRALSAVGRPAGVVEVAVVDDAEIRRLNARYRGIARRTDVLAFPLEAPATAAPLVGQPRAGRRVGWRCRWRWSWTCSSRTVRFTSWATTTATRWRPT